ncbi:hypothetical protein HUSEC41_24024, partial [Escherichia coli O104:H4 str. 01-09591]
WRVVWAAEELMTMYAKSFIALDGQRTSDGAPVLHRPHLMLTTPATCVAVHSDTIRNTTLNFPGLNTLTTG